MISADTLDLMRFAARAALEKKAFQVVSFDVSELTSFTDCFVICSGASARQVSAIVDEVGRQLKEQGRSPLHVEGKAESEWVLLDYGEIIVHVFTEDRRSYYALDSLWGDAPRIDDATLVDLGGSSEKET